MRKVRIFSSVADDAKDMQAVEIACGLSPWTLDGYESELGREDCAAFIDRTNGREAVCFMIGRVPLISGAVAEIFNIGILPDFRRHGVGNALLSEFLNVCRNLSVSEVWLEARSSNQEAIVFYKANGFEPKGIRPNFYQNPAGDAQLMTLRLIQGS